MNKITTDYLHETFGIDSDIIERVEKAEKELAPVFEKLDEILTFNQYKVLHHFQKARINDQHFAWNTGYGYDDIGRDTLDLLFADCMQAEAALVRPTIVNGTHALFLALSGLLYPNDILLSITGKPYDTLEKAIGISGNEDGALNKFGIRYKQIDLLEDGSIDTDAIERTLNAQVKMVYVQRSRGYGWRNSLGQKDLEDVFSLIHYLSPKCIIMVDNCYCEFCEENEPTYYGADVMAGSLIKNPGGGLAPTGGYIAGKRELINCIAQRLTVPGIGAEVGSYAGDYRMFYQGLFMAPHTVAECLKTAVLFAKAFEILDFETLPSSESFRADIVQSVKLGDPEKLRVFCRCIQEISPVDSNVTPEEWEMPGYDDKVIMAAGTFVQGATSELSADGPMKQPYIAYLQGGLTYAHGKIAAMYVCDSLMKML